MSPNEPPPPGPRPGGNIGMIGLAVMGRNLALNLADHGHRVAVWNLEPAVTDAFIAEFGRERFVPTRSLAELVGALERPRLLWMMIKAGKPVDDVLAQLVPLLDPGDVVIDGGNTHFEETRRREGALAPRGILFVGMGVSGGGEGARRGPSLMPGGAPQAWSILAPALEAIAARTDSGPCVTHVGPDGAGHFVKMVHNGIEYGDMQLLAEAYDLLGRGAGLSPAEMAGIFAEWNQGPLASYLVEITAKILTVRDPESGDPLLDRVLDKAGQKGTGRWTADMALDLGVPIPTIAAAVDARFLSGRKAERVAASAVLPGPGAAGVEGPVIGAHSSGASPGAPHPGGRPALIQAVADGLLGAKIVCYAQGLDLIRGGSERYGWGISLFEMARIWKGGCIIRARLLDDIMEAFGSTPKPSNLLVHPAFADRLAKVQAGWRAALGAAMSRGIPAPAISASLAYFDGFRSARLPQNLTQAQRDAFGAHTYERTDKPQLGPVHTDWLS